MKIEELIPRLVRACLDNDRRLVEEISTMLVKLFKKNNPDIAREISQSLTYSRNGVSTMRSVDVQSLPIDKDSRFSLCKTEEPLEMEPPVLASDTLSELYDFINERNKIEKLILEDITPPNSLLFIGEPGVGKTYSAKWLSLKLNLPLITMDLATSISSYLGRSGQNIKSIFGYARSFPSILLLDEIDSIAKRRDDSSDLGELKRLVNVLLQELEIWPSQSVVIAATNHPDLLDKAIWRRFDRTINFRLPEMEERTKLLKSGLVKYIDVISSESIAFAVKMTESFSAADICKLCMHIKRKIILENKMPEFVIFEEFCTGKYKNKESKIEICKIIKETNRSLSKREISQITKIPLTSVNRYLQCGGIPNE